MSGQRVDPVGTPTASQGAKRRVVEGGAWTFLAWATSAVTAPLVAIAMVRLMPRQEYGALAIAMAVTSVLTPLASLGLATAVAQITSVEMTDRGAEGLYDTLAAALRVAAMVLAGLVPLGAVLVFVLHQVPSTRAAAVPTSVMLPGVLVSPYLAVATGFLQATYRPRLLGSALAGSVLLSAALVFAALLSGEPAAVEVAAARTVGFVLVMAVPVIAVVRFHRRHQRRPNPPLTRRLVSFGTASLLSVMFGQVISQLDVLLVGATRGTGAAASYAPASRAIDMIFTIPPLLGVFLLPALARAVAGGERAEAHRLYQWASRWTLAAAAPALGVLLVLPGPLLAIVFGAAYRDVGTPARIMAVGATFHVLVGFNGLMLDAYGVPRVVAVMDGIGVATNVLACVLLIPPFGLVGAATATTVALVTSNALTSVALYRRFGAVPWDRALAVTVGAFACALVAALALSRAKAMSDLAGVTLVAVLVGGVTVCASLLAGGATERRAIVTYLGRLRGRSV